MTTPRAARAGYERAPLLRYCSGVISALRASTCEPHRSAREGALASRPAAVYVLAARRHAPAASRATRRRVCSLVQSRAISGDHACISCHATERVYPSSTPAWEGRVGDTSWPSHATARPPSSTARREEHAERRRQRVDLVRREQARDAVVHLRRAAGGEREDGEACRHRDARAAPRHFLDTS